jgi:hypothetical protein
MVVAAGFHLSYPVYLVLRRFEFLHSGCSTGSDTVTTAKATATNR